MDGEEEEDEEDDEEDDEDLDVTSCSPSSDRFVCGSGEGVCLLEAGGKGSGDESLGGDVCLGGTMVRGEEKPCIDRTEVIFEGDVEHAEE